MSAVDAVELVAWILSAVIAGWLMLDMIRVSRRYDEQQLVSAADHREGLAVGELAESTPGDDR